MKRNIWKTLVLWNQYHIVLYFVINKMLIKKMSDKMECREIKEQMQLQSGKT